MLCINKWLQMCLLWLYSHPLRQDERFFTMNYFSFCSNGCYPSRWGNYFYVLLFICYAFQEDICGSYSSFHCIIFCVMIFFAKPYCYEVCWCYALTNGSKCACFDCIVIHCDRMRGFSQWTISPSVAMVAIHRDEEIIFTYYCALLCLSRRYLWVIFVFSLHSIMICLYSFFWYAYFCKTISK